MDLGLLIKSVPATFWGIVVGSFFTVIGVVLTNVANTQRLRLQHQHEWTLESKERDLALRRDTYLEAMEAIASAVAAIGRFGNLNIASDDLMMVYTDKSPAIGKVSIVGKEETIQAVADFSRELTGAFLRLSSKREKLNWLMQRSASLDEKIEQVLREQERIQAQLNACRVSEQRDESTENALQKNLKLHEQRIEALRADEMELMQLTFPGQMDLVRETVSEVATLDRMLVPVISLIRAELELPFDADFYARIIEDGARRQMEYLDDYIREVSSAVMPDSDEPARADVPDSA
jgi:hypothetical protein